MSTTIDGRFTTPRPKGRPQQQPRRGARQPETPRLAACSSKPPASARAPRTPKLPAYVRHS